MHHKQIVLGIAIVDFGQGLYENPARHELNDLLNSDSERTFFKYVSLLRTRPKNILIYEELYILYSKHH